MTDAPKVNIRGNVTLSDAAELLELTPRRIAQLSRSGHIPRPAAHGLYPLLGVIRGYVRSVRETAVRKPSVSTEKLKDLKVREMELKVAVMENKYVHVDEFFAGIDIVSGAMVTELNSLPAQFTRDLAERDRLEELINVARGRWCKKLAEVSRQLKANGEMEGDPYDDAD